MKTPAEKSAGLSLFQDLGGRVPLAMDFDRVLEFFRALNDQRVEYVVFGAVALGAHGIVRATMDVDLFVDPSPGNVASLRRALQAVWDDPEIEQITSEDLEGDYPAIQYGPPGEEFTIDLLSRLGQAFRYDQIESELVMLGEVPIRVVTPRMLYEMKRDAVRLKDRADAEALKARFGFEE